MKYIGFMVCEGVTKNRTTNLVSPKARVYTSQPLKSLPRSAHNPPTSSSGNTKSIPRPSEKTWTQETSSSQLSRPVLPSIPHQSSLPLENSKFLPYRSLSLSLSLCYLYLSLRLCIFVCVFGKWGLWNEREIQLNGISGNWKEWEIRNPTSCILGFLFVSPTLFLSFFRLLCFFESSISRIVEWTCCVVEVCLGTCKLARVD